MTSDTVLKGLSVLVPAVVAFVVARYEQGGRRRRLRKDIREQLELMSMLDRERMHDAESAVREQLERDLARYAPPREKVRKRAVALVQVITIVVLWGASSISGLSDMVGVPMSFALGAAIALVAVVLGELLGRGWVRWQHGPATTVESWEWPWERFLRYRGKGD